MMKLNTGMMSGIKNEFRIGETVYHTTPDSIPAVILDVVYSQLMNKFTYVVSTGWGMEFECEEFELTRNKTF